MKSSAQLLNLIHADRAILAVGNAWREDMRRCQIDLLIRMYTQNLCKIDLSIYRFSACIIQTGHAILGTLTSLSAF